MPRNRKGRLEGGPRYLTTARAAELLGVSAPTVAKWADQGRLSSLRTPGGHRRILSADVARLASAQGLEAPTRSVPGIRAGIVLVVEPSPDVADTVKALVESRSRIEVKVVHDAFSAGFLAGRERLSLVIVDPTMPDLDPFGALPLLQQGSEGMVPVVGLAAVLDAEIQALVDEGLIHRVLQKPHDLSRIWDVAQEVLAQLKR